MPDLAAQAAVELASLTKDERARAAEVSRAVRAKAIIEDPMVVDALAAIEREVYDAWRSVAAPDVANREMLYDLSRAVQMFRNYFANILTTGQMAQLQLRSVKGQQEFRERRLGMVNRGV
jgi:hypothetical protein